MIGFSGGIQNLSWAPNPVVPDLGGVCTDSFTTTSIAARLLQPRKSVARDGTEPEHSASGGDPPIRPRSRTDSVRSFRNPRSLKTPLTRVRCIFPFRLPLEHTRYTSGFQIAQGRRDKYLDYLGFALLQ